MKIINKGTLKQFNFVTEENFNYPGSLVSIMQEDNSWFSLMDHAKKTFGDFEIYIVVSETGSYWKTDGQVFCVTAYGVNVKEEYAVNLNVKVSYDIKDLKADAKIMFDRVLDIDGDKIKNLFEDKTKNYPWQCAKGGILINILNKHK